MSKAGQRPHQVSYETIAHFRCLRCSSWWSIADRSMAPYKLNGITCPTCGLHSHIKEDDTSSGP